MMPHHHHRTHHAVFGQHHPLSSYNNNNKGTREKASVPPTASSFFSCYPLCCNMPSSSFSARHSRTLPWAFMGGILSIYALYVESMVHRRQTHPEAEPFVALCDIEQIGASCSNVFQLPEGRMLTYFRIVPHGSMLDVPNAALGWVYYTLWLVVVPKLPRTVIFVVASLAMASSVWLAVQLLLLRELCLLCWSTHVINARLWWCAFSNMRSSLARMSTPKEKKIKRV